MLLNYNCLRWQSRIGLSSHFGTVVLAAMTNLGCQCDAPGKRDPQLENHLHQTGLWACPWGNFLDCWLMCEGQIQSEQQWSWAGGKRGHQLVIQYQVVIPETYIQATLYRPSRLHLEMSMYIHVTALFWKRLWISRRERKKIWEALEGENGKVKWRKKGTKIILL